MKLALAALLLFSSVPAAQAYESQSGYAKEQKCFKKVYRERYIPGTMKNPGYVKTERKRVRVPCQKMFGEDIWREPAYEESYYPTPRRTYRPAEPVRHHVDNNDCTRGTICWWYSRWWRCRCYVQRRWSLVGNSSWSCWWCNGRVSN